MSRYIDADRIVYWIRHTSRDGLEDDIRRVAFKDAIERIPTADVQEVKHGKWIYKGHHEMMGHAFQCSICTRWMFTNSPECVVEEYPYCHCGAKMESVKGLEED